MRATLNESPFIVRYIPGRNWLIIVGLIPLILLFYMLSVLFVIIGPELISDTMKKKGLIDALGIVLTYPIFFAMSFWLTIATIRLYKSLRRSIPALILNESGVEGEGWIGRKQLSWNEVHNVYRSKNSLMFIGKSRLSAPQWLSTLMGGFDRHHIAVPLGFVDTPEEELYRKIREYAPKFFQ